MKFKRILFNCETKHSHVFKQCSLLQRFITSARGYGNSKIRGTLCPEFRRQRSKPRIEQRARSKISNLRRSIGRSVPFSLNEATEAVPGETILCVLYNRSLPDHRSEKRILSGHVCVFQNESLWSQDQSQVLFVICVSLNFLYAASL